MDEQLALVPWVPTLPSSPIIFQDIWIFFFFSFHISSIIWHNSKNKYNSVLLIEKHSAKRRAIAINKNTLYVVSCLEILLNLNLIVRTTQGLSCLGNHQAVMMLSWMQLFCCTEACEPWGVHKSPWAESLHLQCTEPTSPINESFTASLPLPHLWWGESSVRKEMEKKGRGRNVQDRKRREGGFFRDLAFLLLSSADGVQEQSLRASGLIPHLCVEAPGALRHQLFSIKEGPLNHPQRTACMLCIYHTNFQQWSQYSQFFSVTETHVSFLSIR